MSRMQFLKFEFDDAGPDDVIEVTLDRRANVRLLDASNFNAFRAGRAHRYLGGHAHGSPVRLRPPRDGAWVVVVDLGGHVGSVRASARLLRAA